MRKLIAVLIVGALASAGCATGESSESDATRIGNIAAREAATREANGQSPAEAESQAQAEIYELSEKCEDGVCPE